MRLMNKGLRVGLITNDQAPELVDSELLKLSDLRVAEVSGSCFCCNFNRIHGCDQGRFVPKPRPT